MLVDAGITLVNRTDKASVFTSKWLKQLQLHGLEPARLLCSWNSPGKKTLVGSHFLLQGIFLTQEIEPGSPGLQADSLPSEPPGKSWTLKKQ